MKQLTIGHKKPTIEQIEYDEIMSDLDLLAKEASFVRRINERMSFDNLEELV